MGIWHALLQTVTIRSASACMEQKTQLQRLHKMWVYGNGKHLTLKGSFEVIWYNLKSEK